MNNFGVTSRPDRAPEFPVVRWKNEWATFIPAAPLPEGDVPAPAALVFPFYGDRVALADIRDRGWCIPSGRLESGETPEQAVRREAHEEAGLRLGKVALLGYYRFVAVDSGELVRCAPTFIAEVANFEAIPEGSESLGMQLAAVEDVAGLYFSWDPLLAAVFAFAWSRKRTLLRAGTSLADWMNEGAG